MARKRKTNTRKSSSKKTKKTSSSRASARKKADYASKSSKKKKSSKASKSPKQSKVEVYGNKKQKSQALQSFLIVLIIILAIAAIFSAIKTFAPDLLGSASLSGELAAKVNHQEITMQELNADYEQLPQQYKQFISKEAFLQQMIDETLLLQEARARGLEVSSEELDQSLTDFMQSNNLTQEDLEQMLEQREITREELVEMVRRQLLIEEIIDIEVNSKVDVTTEQALEYYNDNSENFVIPEMVTARHILISTSTRTQEEAEELAADVFEMLEQDKFNFCELVEEYSEDAGSADNCGEYTFPRGRMAERFEQAAFEQDAGEVTLINTSFGYHIIWTINKTEEQLVAFEDVQEQITTVLETQQQKMLYSDFIAELRAEADIINYYAAEQETEEAVQEAEEAAEQTAENIEVSVEETAETASEEIVEVEEEIVQEAEEIEQAVEEQVDEAEQLVEEEIAEPEEEPVEDQASDEEEVLQTGTFAECLTAQDAVLYGAYWDTSTKKQKSMFGPDVAKLNYIECGVEGDYRAQADICVDAGIQAYPTWVIDGKKHMGVLSFDYLSEITGCPV